MDLFQYRNHRIVGKKLTIIITGVVFGIVCALALALIPLYISKHDPIRSDQNSMHSTFACSQWDICIRFLTALASDIISLQYATNYHLGETRALAAISKKGLATSVSIIIH